MSVIVPEAGVGMSIIVPVEFQGHISKVELGGPGHLSFLAVHVIAQRDACGEPLVLFVPRSQGPHWVPGRIVRITAAVDNETTSTEKLMVKGLSETA